MEMRLKVSGAAAAPQNGTPFHFVTTAAALDAVPEYAVLVGDIVFDGTLLRTGDGFRVSGTAKTRRSFVCDRCLKECSESVTYVFSEDFLRPDGQASGDGESDFEGEALDIAPLVHDAVLTAQPMQNLCRPDCRGLCPRCGADLNERDCGCDRRRIDPRLAALETLLRDADEKG